MPSLSQEFLDAARQRTDPPADQAIATLVQRAGKPSAKQLFDTLIRQIDLPIDQLPPEIVAFIQAHRQLPNWIDYRKIQLAQDLFVDHGPKFLLFLYYKSLPILYACAHGAKVLVHTGRLSQQQDTLKVFSRRIAETGQFLINVMEEGSFDPTGQAIDTTLKIRLIHAAIRHFIPAGHWDAENWGKPINQEDMAITLMTFSVSLTDALQDMGIDEPRDRQEAFLHCWKVVGFLLGIEPELLPQKTADARSLLNVILKRQAAASPEGQQLTKALITFAEQTLPSQRFKSVPSVLIPFLIGEDLAKLLAVKPNQGCLMPLLPDVLSTFFQWGEKLEDRSQPLHFIIDELSKELVGKMVNFFNEEKGVHFRVPKEWK